MRRSIRLAIPALIVFSVAACHQSPSQKASGVASHEAPPSSATDSQAWESYMENVSDANLKGLSAKPYLFEVLAPNDPRAKERNPNIQQALTEMAKGNHFPGNAIAVGGPDANSTAEVLTAAFSAAKPGSLKGLTVLFIGDENNEVRVKKTIDASGAVFRFASM